MLDVSRVQKELVEIERDKHLSGVSIATCEDNLARMKGSITGPIGTPYEGGIFFVDIHLPCTYFFFQSCSFRLSVAGNYLPWKYGILSSAVDQRNLASANRQQWQAAFVQELDFDVIVEELISSRSQCGHFLRCLKHPKMSICAVRRSIAGGAIGGLMK